MALAVRVLTGPLKTRFAALKEGLTFGRKGAKLTLPDRKVSQIHAIVEKNAAGQLILKDRSSGNAIVVAQKRRSSVLLSPGLVFTLGETQLEVGTLSEDGKRFVSSRPEGIPVEPMTWNEYFTEFCEESAKASKDRPKNFQPFCKLVAFEFLRGPMTSRKYFMAYGPRSLGPNSYEFPLADPKLPEDLLIVSSEADKIRLKTMHPGLVKQNKKPMMTATVESGDLLELPGNLIRIHLKEIS